MVTKGPLCVERFGRIDKPLDDEVGARRHFQIDRLALYELDWLAAKKPASVSVGTMRTDDSLFGGVLAGTVLILGALTFFPILALGPVAEQLAMVAGKVFS